MQIFYTPDILTTYELPEEEGKHAVRVLRLTEGDRILLTDGKGHFYTAVIIQANPKHCQVNIIEDRHCPPFWDFNLHIAIAPTKNMDRMEWFIEKATEIGINEVSFLKCHHSERKDIKISRLEKIAVSAMKQSQKATLPVLNPMISFKDLIKKSFEGRKVIAHCEPGEKTLLKNALAPHENALILIGPEGDFSPEEISLARQHGFEAISLGVSRLRTETAALNACQSVHIINM